MGGTCPSTSSAWGTDRATMLHRQDEAYRRAACRRSHRSATARQARNEHNKEAQEPSDPTMGLCIGMGGSTLKRSTPGAAGAAACRLHLRGIALIVVLAMIIRRQIYVWLQHRGLVCHVDTNHISRLFFSLMQIELLRCLPRGNQTPRDVRNRRAHV